jgi:hypothetical protein
MSNVLNIHHRPGSLKMLLHTRFDMPRSNGSLVITFKPKAKISFSHQFVVLQSIKIVPLIKAGYVSKICCCTSIQGHKLSGISVIAKSPCYC